MKQKLRVAIVGAGVFGNYHAGKISAHPRAELIAIVDPDMTRAASIADTYKTETHTPRAASILTDVLSEIDAVIVSVPAKFHAEVAQIALGAGKHVLVEKPIAKDMAAAQALVESAKNQGCVLQVGHQERFVMQAIGLYAVPEKPTEIKAKRFSPYSVRNTDVSVTLDLMSHDIELVLSLMGAPISVNGHSQAVKSDTPDVSNGTLHFQNGATAFLQASRVAEASERIMKLTYPSGSVEIDFNSKTLTHTTPFQLNADFGQSPDAKDSLGAADDAFIRSCLDGARVFITGEDGAAALKIALQIDGDI